MKMIIFLFVAIVSVGAYSQTLKPNILRKIYTDKSIYVFGETIHITIRAVNTSLIKDTLVFPDLCDAYPFIDDIDYLMRFSLGCYAAIDERQILPQDSLTWKYDYPHKSKPDMLLSVGAHRIYGDFRGVCPNTDTIYVSVKESLARERNEHEQVSFLMEQNYPNPFNPSTVIEFNLSKRSLVNLTIYNLFGQPIVTLVQAQLEAGSHRYGWTASNISSGIYFYRLMTGDYSVTKRLVFAK